MNIEYYKRKPKAKAYDIYYLEITNEKNIAKYRMIPRTQI